MYLHKTYQIQSTFTSHFTASMFTVSVFIFLTLTANVPVLLLSFHNMSSVPSIVLNIQHFVKPFRVTSGEMWCHAIVIHWQTSLREFKFGIINSCDTIWNAGCACSPLPYVSWTLTNHNWLYSLLSSLIHLHMKIWQCRAWFELAQSGSVLHTYS